MAWNLHTVEQMQLRRHHRVDGVGRLKFDFHTGSHAFSGAIILISKPVVSWSLRYVSTLLMRLASCARVASNQKMAGDSVALARATARRTQSWIGESLVWHMRQMSPCFTSCSMRTCVVIDA
jgi:hypothetical protein